MKNVSQWKLCITICLAIAMVLLLPMESNARQTTAKEITSQSLVTESSGFPALKYLFNNKYWETQKTQDVAHLTLEHGEGIGSLYLSFMYAYGPYTITCNDTGDTYTAGTDLFIHEFIDLTACFGLAPSSVTISFENGPAYLHELDVFTEGEVPDHIEKWSHPEEGKIDLILFASHSDDDQLFFAGLLPYYAIERDYQVLVVYLTDHYNTAPGRVHEVLRGLWAVGVRNYPILGHFEDFGDATTADEAFRNFTKYGHSRDEMTGFVVEQLRRFKPMVVVGHDIKGEYGHAQHKAYSQMLIDAVTVSNDPQQHPESAEQYGLWDVPKTYIHLYKENPIVMDWDQPMGNFNGMTPYQVSKELGFPHHVSQQKGWGWYYDGKETAASIKDYSPCKYGLYHTTVGPDSQKNDMFENLLSHREQFALSSETLPPVTEPETQTEAPIPSIEEIQTEVPTVPLVTAPAKQQPESTISNSTPSSPLTEDALSPIWILAESILVIALAVLVILKRKRIRNRH